MLDSVKLGEDVIVFNPSQRELINEVLNEDLTLKDTVKKQNAFFGGFRAGKSFLYQLLAFLLCLVYPGISIIYVRKTYDRLKDSVIAQFRKDFEKYGQFNYLDNSKDGSRIARFSNGSTIRFRAFDTDSSILSAEYDVAFMCQAEECSEELYQMLFGRLSGHILPRTLLFAEGNPSGNWVKRVFYDPSQEDRADKDIFFLNCPTMANLENLPSDYLSTLKSQYGEADFARWASGSWQSLYGMVFTEFNDTHIIDPLRREDFGTNEKIIIGGDYGYRNPTAFLWVTKNYDGEYIVWDEFYKAGCLPEEIAENNKRHGTFTTVMDYSIKRPDRDGKSLWDTLLKQGLRLIESNKDEQRNLVVVNSLFKQDKIKITSNCKNLIWELKHYRYPDLKLGAEKNRSESPIDKDNHAIDALLYAIAQMEYRTSLSPEVLAERKSLRSATVKFSRGGVIENG